MLHVGNTAGPAPVTLVPSPENGVRRVAWFLLYNADTSSATATFYLEDQNSRRAFFQVIVEPGDTFFWDEHPLDLAVDRSITVELAAAPAATQPNFLAHTEGG